MARKKSRKERVASKDIISETVNLKVMIDCQKRSFFEEKQSELCRERRLWEDLVQVDMCIYSTWKVDSG